MGKKEWVAFVALAVLSIAGCTTKNTVTEEDRQGVDVERQIAESQDAELDRLEAAVKEDPQVAAVAAPIVARMREKNNDSKQIANALQKNWGPPEKPVTYNHAETPGLIDRILKSHQVGFWAAVGGAFVSGALVLIGLARSPVAKMIPGIGTILTSLDSTFGAIEAWMKKMKEGGRPEVAAGLASVLEAAHEDAKVSPYVAKVLSKVKLTGATPDQVAEAAHAAAHAEISPPAVSTPDPAPATSSAPTA